MRFFLFLSFALCLAGAVRAQDAIFIANKDAKITSISADAVKGILLGTQAKLEDGTAVKLAVLADCPVHEKVIQDYTQKTADQFAKYWKKMVFSGKGLMPAECKSDADMIEFVSGTPGAFGYVAKGSATAAVTVLEVK